MTELLGQTIKTKVQITEKQIMPAVVHKLESMHVEDGYESADMLGKKLPITGIPSPQVATLFDTPLHLAIWRKDQEGREASIHL